MSEEGGGAALADERFGVVVAAAGASLRMQGSDKLWVAVAGRPVLAWTLAALERVPGLSEIVLVVAPERIAAAEALRRTEGWRTVRAIVAGGARRRDSVRRGLDALSPECAWVVVHDGARPLLTPDLVLAGLAAARQTGAATAGEPVKETIKYVREGLIVESLPRAQIARTQTPQVFSRSVLLAAHEAAAHQDFDAPDDAALVSAAGYPLIVFHGSHENLKITAPDDLPVVESLLSRMVRGYV